jgi:hypothetical protein
MPKSIFLIGLGGFGKWVVTAFKHRLLERYGKIENIPPYFRYIAFDLTDVETPNPEFSLFGFGRREIVKLHYSEVSRDFYRFSGNYQHEIQKISVKASDINPFISKFISEKEAKFYTADFLKKDVAAGERRLTSRTVFFLDSSNIYQKLDTFLQDNCLCFIVSSIAGGTGCGSLLDFLILLQHIMKEREHKTIYRIPILFLPQGFKKVKENEDLSFLEANCYAFVREFQRIDSKETQVNISYSTSLQKVEKRTQEVLADLTFFLDGENIGGERGDEIPYYNGAVLSIVDFIESFWHAEEYELEETKKGTRLPTSYDNIIKNNIDNNRNLAKDSPRDALIYNTLGTFKWIFDTELIKREFAQKMAIDVLAQYLEPPDIDRKDVAQSFLKEEATNFANQIIYQLVNKGSGANKSFATETNLESILRQETPYELKEGKSIKLPSFPPFNFDTAIRLTGNVANAYGQLERYERRVFGEESDTRTPEDLAKGKEANTYYCVLNFYKEFYKKEFEECLRKKLLDILHRYKGESTYGKSSLKNALVFLQELKYYYDRFLGNEEEKIESEFEKAKKNASFDVDYGSVVASFRQKHGRRRYKFLILGNLRNELKEKYKLWNIQKRRRLLWDAIKEIAEANRSYIKFLINEIMIWIGTFEAGKEWIEKNALPAIRTVRNEKRNIRCHQYLTNSEDQWEYEMYEIIRGRRKKDESNPVFAKLPQPSWAEIVKCFSWGFNFPKEGKTRPDPRRPEGSLICIVNKESEVKMPDWPFKDEFEKEDRESILAWNNQLMEYYLTCGKLKDMDKISVMDILFWQGKTSEEIKDEIIKKTTVMLNYREEVHNEIVNRFKIPRESAKMEKITLRGFLETELPIEKYKNYIENIREDLERKNYLIIPGEKNELLVSRSWHLLTIKAMKNITKNKDTYLRIMDGYLNDKNITPHIFQAENRAFYYEAKIADKYKTPHEELHLEVVSILEDETMVKAILFGKIFGKITTDTYKDEEMKDWVKVKIKDLELDFKIEEFYRVRLISKLAFPPEKEEKSYQSAMEKLTREVSEMINSKRREGSYENLLKEKIKELEEELNAGRLNKADQDLYKVWLIMLEEEKKR